MNKIYVKKLREDAVVPKMATIGSAGSDVRACLYDEETGYKITKIKVPAFGTVKIGTGLAFQLPENHVMLIIPRSSTGTKKGLMLQNTVGVLDSDYRGECFLFFRNMKDTPVEIEDGERIAQVIVIPYPTLEYEEVAELQDTERGAGGFGSTGAK